MAKRLTAAQIKANLRPLKDMGLVDIDLRKITEGNLNGKYREKVLRMLRKNKSFQDFEPITIENKEIRKSLTDRLTGSIQSKSSKSKIYFNPNIKKKVKDTKSGKYKEQVVGKVLIDEDTGMVTKNRIVKMADKNGQMYDAIETSVSLPLNFDSAESIYDFINVYKEAWDKGQFKGKAFRVKFWGENTLTTFTNFDSLIEKLELYLGDDFKANDRNLLKKFMKEFEIIEYSNLKEGRDAVRLETLAKDVSSKRISRVNAKSKK